MRNKRIEIKMPFLSPEEVTVQALEWLVPEGAVVEIDQDILKLSVDGTDFLLPAPLDGVLAELAVAPGDYLETGQVLAVVEVI